MQISISIALTYIKWSRYRPGVAQRVGRSIALLFHDRDTRKWWVVSSTPRPHFTPGKDQVHILQEAGWAPGPVWTGGKSRPHRYSIPDRPARSQSLYRLSHRAHTQKKKYDIKMGITRNEAWHCGVESLVSEPSEVIRVEHRGFTADGEFVETWANIGFLICKWEETAPIKIQ